MRVVSIDSEATRATDIRKDIKYQSCFSTLPGCHGVRGESSRGCGSSILPFILIILQLQKNGVDFSWRSLPADDVTLRSNERTGPSQLMLRQRRGTRVIRRPHYDLLGNGPHRAAA